MKKLSLAVMALSVLASFNASAQMGDDIGFYRDNGYLNFQGLEQGAAIVLTDGSNGCSGGRNYYKVLDKIGIKIGDGCWSFNRQTGTADTSGFGPIPAVLFRPTRYGQSNYGNGQPDPEARGRKFDAQKYDLPHGSGDYNNPGWKSW